jgi:hypothetical protein
VAWGDHAVVLGWIALYPRCALMAAPGSSTRVRVPPCSSPGARWRAGCGCATPTPRPC